MNIQNKNLRIEQTRNDDVITCKLQGWLDPNTSPDLINKIDLTGVTTLVFDMSGVEYVFSAGLRTFLILQRKLDENNGRLKLTNVPETIKTIFEYAGFESMIDING